MIPVKAKKKSLKATRKGYSKSKVLTAEEHILKQRVLYYLTDESASIRDVARKLHTTVPRIKSFFTDDAFVEELEERIEKVYGVDSEFRQKQTKITILNLYEELRRREAEGDLKDLNTRDLFKIISDMQREQRLDTPGEFTSKVGVVDLAHLQGRYEKSLSGKMSRRKSDKTSGVKNVTPLRKQISVGEADNDNQNQSEGSS